MITIVRVSRTAPALDWRILERRATLLTDESGRNARTAAEEYLREQPTDYNVWLITGEPTDPHSSVLEVFRR